MSEIAPVLATIIFVIVTVACAIGIPALIKRVSARFMPDMVAHVFQAILLAYAAIYGVILPLTTWISNL